MIVKGQNDDTISGSFVYLRYKSKGQWYLRTGTINRITYRIIHKGDSFVPWFMMSWEKSDLPYCNYTQMSEDKTQHCCSRFHQEEERKNVW